MSASEFRKLFRSSSRCSLPNLGRSCSSNNLKFTCIREPRSQWPIFSPTRPDVAFASSLKRTALYSYLVCNPWWPQELCRSPTLRFTGSPGVRKQASQLSAAPNLMKPGASAIGPRISTRWLSKPRTATSPKPRPSSPGAHNLGQETRSLARHRRIDCESSRRSIVPSHIPAMQGFPPGRPGGLSSTCDDGPHPRRMEQASIPLCSKVGLSMMARRKVEIVEIQVSASLERRFPKVVASPFILAIMEKDRRLIEAALFSDHRIASLDEAVRRHFRHHGERLPELRKICWVNPDTEDDVCDWLKNGAPAERTRMLGYSPSERS